MVEVLGQKGGCIKLRQQKKDSELSKQSAKYLARLEKSVYEKLKKAINDIPSGNIKPLQGYNSILRLDIDVNKVSYRIIFEWVDNEQVYVLKIKPRGDVYKGGF